MSAGAQELLRKYRIKESVIDILGQEGFTSIDDIDLLNSDGNEKIYNKYGLKIADWSSLVRLVIDRNKEKIMNNYEGRKLVTI